MKAKVMMLKTTPNNETSDGIFLKDRNWYHIYLTDSNAEIKEGNWYLCTLNNLIFPQNSKHSQLPTDKKIITTTDKSLNNLSNVNRLEDFKVPQLSEQSRKLLVDYYNKNGKIPNEVDIETNLIHHDVIGLLKLNSEGTVDIAIPEEKVYSKEEVAKLCASAYGEGYNRGYESSPVEPEEYEYLDLSEWCKKNNILEYWHFDNEDHFL